MAAQGNSKLTDQDKLTELYKYVTSRHNDDDVQPEAEEVRKFYDRNASYYDEFLMKSGVLQQYFGARELTKQLEGNFPKDTKILDVGAGTGRVGLQLKEKYGYTNLVAMDISPGMLEEAKKKNVYNDFIVSDLNEDNLEKYYKQFDHVISIGGFILGVLKPNILLKIANLVNAGGLVCISFREKNLESEKLGYKQQLEEMEAKGIWKEISRVLESYFILEEEDMFIKGYYIVFKVC